MSFMELNLAFLLFVFAWKVLGQGDSLNCTSVFQRGCPGQFCRCDHYTPSTSTTYEDVWIYSLGPSPYCTWTTPAEATAAVGARWNWPFCPLDASQAIYAVPSGAASATGAFIGATITGAAQSSTVSGEIASSSSTFFTIASTAKAAQVTAQMTHNSATGSPVPTSPPSSYAVSTNNYAKHNEEHFETYTSASCGPSCPIYNSSAEAIGFVPATSCPCASSTPTLLPSAIKLIKPRCPTAASTLDSETAWNSTFDGQTVNNTAYKAIQDFCAPGGGGAFSGQIANPGPSSEGLTEGVIDIVAAGVGVGVVGTSRTCDDGDCHGEGTGLGNSVNAYINIWMQAKPNCLLPYNMDWCFAMLNHFVGPGNCAIPGQNTDLTFGGRVEDNCAIIWMTAGRLTGPDPLVSGNPAAPSTNPTLQDYLSSEDWPLQS